MNAKMNNRLVDLHCHLDLFPDFEELVKECESEKIYTLGVTTTPRAWNKNNSITSKTKYVRTALGLHPQLVKDFSHEIDLFCSLVPDCKFIGEVGLDGTPDYLHCMDLQIDIFKTILKCSSLNGGRIMSLHSRRAANKVIECINGQTDAGRFVLHWFSGTHKELEKAIALDCWFSIGNPMLLSVKGCEIINRIPKEKILTETDGPFTKNGDLPARPKVISETVQMLSKLWKVDLESTKSQIASNLEALLNTK